MERDESGSPRRSWRAVLQVGLSEVGAVLQLGAASVVPRALPEPVVRPHLPPVVLVHGFLARAGTLKPLQRALLEAGAPIVQAVDYPSTRLSLEAIVDRIASVVLPLARAHGPVVLVGHSLGAFAARAWVKAFGGAPHVGLLISIGGPHAGTSLHPLLSPALRGVLDPEGVWVRRLAAGPEPVPTLVLRARYDHQVFPPVRARIEGAEERIVELHGHNGLLVAPEVHAAVIEALTAYGSRGASS